MRFRKTSTSALKVMGPLNMTPLIDTALTLLIAFMLAGSFGFNTGLGVELPKAKAPTMTEVQNTVITITRNNEIFLNEQKVSLEQLPVVLLEKVTGSKEKTVLIKPDRRVETGQLVEVMAIAKSVGVEALGIATEPQ